MVKLVKGHWYLFNDRGETHIGQYIGRQKGFECCVCWNGCNAHTFNIWHNESSYETWGYGEKHMPLIQADLGEKEAVIIDE